MRTKHKRLSWLAVALMAPLAWGQAMAQTLPDAGEVIAKYVAAIGGRDAVMRQSARRTTGTFAVPAQGITGNFEAFAMAPNRAVLHANVPGLGDVAGGYDGEVAWSLNPAMGPMVLEGRMLDQMRQQSDLYAPLHGEDFIKSMETVEAVDFEGTPCYKVKIVTVWDEEYHEYFSRDSGLLIGSVRQSATPMGEMEATTVYADYTEVAGLLIPYKSVQRMMGFEQVFTAETIEPATVPDSVFALPREIKALIGK
ncbi:MAG TPA: hypothetical protein VGA37_05535 [Gemmatimonadales bacterium]